MGWNLETKIEELLAHWEKELTKRRAELAEARRAVEKFKAEIGIARKALVEVDPRVNDLLRAYELKESSYRLARQQVAFLEKSMKNAMTMLRIYRHEYPKEIKVKKKQSQEHNL